MSRLFSPGVLAGLGVSASAGLATALGSPVRLADGQGELALMAEEQ
jgi:hypothetical protein